MRWTPREQGNFGVNVVASSRSSQMRWAWRGTFTVSLKEMDLFPVAGDVPLTIPVVSHRNGQVTSVIGDLNVENQVTVAPVGTSDRVRSGSRQIKGEMHMASKKIAVLGLNEK
jgi:hypothetical protein